MFQVYLSLSRVNIAYEMTVSINFCWWRNVCTFQQDGMTQATKIRNVAFCIWLDSPQWTRASSFPRFLYHTQRRPTVGRTHLDDWSARRRDLYLTTHNNHNRQTSCARWDSNPQSQQAIGRRTTPKGTATLEPETTQHNSLDRLQTRK
jgi:hypothetical protein